MKPSKETKKLAEYWFDQGVLEANGHAGEFAHKYNLLEEFQKFKKEKKELLAFIDDEEDLVQT